MTAVYRELVVDRFIADRIAEHRGLLDDRLTRLRVLSCDTAEGNAQIADLAAMDQQVAFFCNDLRECCEREEAMVFPALTRLQHQTHVSHGHAGMVRARLRF